MSRRLPATTAPVAALTLVPSVAASVAEYLSERERTKQILAWIEANARAHEATARAIETMSANHTAEAVVICQTILATDDVETKRLLAAALMGGRQREVEIMAQLIGAHQRASNRIGK